MSRDMKIIMLLGALVAVSAGLLWVAADELALQAKRADTATNLAEVAAWQVSDLLREARQITAEAAARREGDRM